MAAIPQQQKQQQIAALLQGLHALDAGLHATVAPGGRLDLVRLQAALVGKGVPLPATHGAIPLLQALFQGCMAASRAPAPAAYVTAPVLKRRRMMTDDAPARPAAAGAGAEAKDDDGPPPLEPYMDCLMAPEEDDGDWGGKHSEDLEEDGAAAWGGPGGMPGLGPWAGAGAASAPPLAAEPAETQAVGLLREALVKAGCSQAATTAASMAAAAAEMSVLGWDACMAQAAARHPELADAAVKNAFEFVMLEAASL